MIIENKDHISYTFPCMSTKCSIQIYKGGINIQKAFEEIEKNTKFLEKKYNFYDQNSYLNKTINNRKKSKLKLDKQSSRVLKKVKEFSKNVNFLFDISVGTYKHCYMHKDIKTFEECMLKLKDKSGFDSWNLNKNFIEFAHKETKLDLGGVIKEFAVDEAVCILKKHGIYSAIVNFGGDLFALGTKPSGELFTIGVKNPNDKNTNLLNIQIKNQALTTSAHYERSYDIENKNFSHILSKQGNTENLLSATIISQSVLKSGIYSTSFMINTDIFIPDDMKVVLIDKDLRIHQNLYT